MHMIDTGVILRKVSRLILVQSLENSLGEKHIDSLTLFY